VAQTSAGILLYRRRFGTLEVLLGHFGGPYWAKKDEGAWAIPKGLIEANEDPEAAAGREFAEELGTRIEAPLLPLGVIRQAGGKVVHAFACEGDLDADAIVSNAFSVEWPPKSGRFGEWPEIDRAAWFTLDEAAAKILPSQRPLLDLLEGVLAE
jgi:predicted NUDIX family NTP pyrophosphohydrolase